MFSEQKTLSRVSGVRRRLRQGRPTKEFDIRMLRNTIIPLAFVFATAGFASATTYNVKVMETTNVHGTELKPGEYKLDVDNGKAVFRHGKTSVETAAKLATSDRKYKDTKFLYDNGSDGKLTLREIDLGGSNVKLLFEE